MAIHHIIPADRLTKRYFRRWFYWHGISRAMLYAQTKIDMEAPEDTVLDFSKVPHIAGVPRYMYRSCFRAFKNMVYAGLRRDRVAVFEHELWIWFFAGIVRQRFQDRKRDAVPGKPINAPSSFRAGLTLVASNETVAGHQSDNKAVSVEPGTPARRMAIK
jgi:hypothetical protein